jgi:ATP-dependent exoDNAse (exonuclease V) alpha subunit
VDEAAMLATQHLARLAAAARASGAKLILAGDDKQLSSIERGGMFETLRQTHGAAILKDVQRVADAEQKEAFGQMHEGEFLDALKTFDKAGGLHWSEKQSDALRGMAAKYTADLAATPDKHRFMFAFTNVEVDALNDYARSLEKQRGDLGVDHQLAAASGAADFAPGDRIQFTGNGRTPKEKNAGLTNGRVGTITDITTENGKARVTVQLDTAKGKKPQSVSFVVGEDSEAGEFNRFKRGYAGTIYRGQGRTLDQSYVCHSAQWRSSAAYVVLTRHRESVHILAARETVKDIESMAQGMGRAENKRAATAFRIDEAHLARATFGQAAQEATEPRAVPVAREKTVVFANRNARVRRSRCAT